MHVLYSPRPVIVSEAWPATKDGRGWVTAAVLGWRESVDLVYDPALTHDEQHRRVVFALLRALDWRCDVTGAPAGTNAMFWICSGGQEPPGYVPHVDISAHQAMISRIHLPGGMMPPHVFALVYDHSEQATAPYDAHADPDDLHWRAMEELLQRIGYEGWVTHADFGEGDYAWICCEWMCNENGPWPTPEDPTEPAPPEEDAHARD